MEPSNKIDIHSLMEEARSSEDKESYRTLEKTYDYRIGIGVRTATKSLSFFLEVFIYHHSKKDDITQQLPLLKKLQERGYLVSCQDETCTVLEILIPQDSLSTELSCLKTILYKTFQD